MSFCRSKSIDKNNTISQSSKLKKRSLDVNKLFHTKIRNYSEDLFMENDLKRKLPLRRAETNKIKELPLKIILENHEKSTFFTETNEKDPKDTIQDSELNFLIKHDSNCKEEELSPKATRSSAQKSWGVILNVFKAINNMKNVDTKSVQSLTQLDKSFNFFETIHNNRKKNKADFILKMDREKELDPFNENFENITRQIKLFEYIGSGLDENLPKIIEIVKNDSMRNVYDKTENKYYFINQKNHEGITPLYAACLNGHIKVVEVLMKYNANHLIKCGGPEDEESILELAIRWGHIKLVEYLLSLEWPNEYLKAALKLAIEHNNEYLKKLIKKAMVELKNKSKKKHGCRCFG